MNNTERVKELYEKGLYVADIADIMKISPSNVSIYLNKIYGTERRYRRKPRKKTYTINESYFEKIDSEDKAYFLGLLYADGCMSTVHDVVQIALKEEDKYILEKFSNYIGSNKPLRLLKGSLIKGFKNMKKDYYRKNQYIMIIYSSKLKTQLKNLGITPNKTFTLKFPNMIDEMFMNHFIRGLFDGDGGIYGYSKNKWEISIAGNKEFNDKLCEYLINKNIRCRVDKHSSLNVYYIRIAGRLNCIDLYNFMYSDATIFFKRKYNKFLECINSTTSIRNDNTWKKKS